MKPLGTASNTWSRRHKNGMRIAAWLLAILLAGMAIDLQGLVRIRAFERDHHDIRHASGVASVVPVRKHGALLHLQSQEGSYDLSCNVPGLGGSNNCDYRHAPRSGVLTEADWVVAPGGLFDGTVAYPIGIRQGGEQVYQIEVQQVAAGQSRRVVGDIEFLGIASGLVGLFLVLGAVRRRMRRIA